MSQTIKLKRSSVPSNIPAAGNLEIGEIALNMADSKLFFKDGASNVKELTPTTISGALEWTQVNNTPTTLSGYGITDAATSAQGALANTALQNITSESIESLIDVNTMIPTDGQVLTWDNVNSRWDAATPVAGAGAEVFIQSTEPVTWELGDVWIKV